MLLLNLFTSLAFAVETVGQTTTALTINRIALSSNTQYGVRLPKWEEDGNALKQGTGYSAVGELNVTPAFARVGGRFTITPLAIMKLQAYGFGTYYVGNFQTIIGYDSADSVYGDNAMIKDYVTTEDELGIPRQTSGVGWNAGAKLTLQAKVSNVVFSNTVDYGHQVVVKPDDIEGVATFEREREVMLNFGGDQILENNTLLLYQIDKTEDKYLRVGNLTTYRRSMGANDAMLRSGLLSVFQTDPKHNHILIVQHYIQDDLGFTASTREGGFAPYVAYAYKYFM